MGRAIAHSPRRSCLPRPKCELEPTNLGEFDAAAHCWVLCEFKVDDPRKVRRPMALVSSPNMTEVANFWTWSHDLFVLPCLTPFFSFSSCYRSDQQGKEMLLEL